MDLLTGICNEFDKVQHRHKQIPHTIAVNQHDGPKLSSSSNALAHSLSVVVGRINLLVYLSKRVLLALESRDELRHALIRALFYV